MVTQHTQKFKNLMELMGVLWEMREALRKQERTIMSLTNCVKVLERRERRRSSGSSSSWGMGSPVYGTAWTGSGTRVPPVMEHPVQINFLEPVSDSEEEREVHVVENTKPVLVRALTLGLSHPSLAERLGVNFSLWRDNGGTSDGDQSGSDGWAGVNLEVRQVIQGSPLSGLYCLVLTNWFRRIVTGSGELMGSGGRGTGEWTRG